MKFLLSAFLLPSLAMASTTKLCQDADPSISGKQIQVVFSSGGRVQAQLIVNGKSGRLVDCNLVNGDSAGLELSKYECSIRGGAQSDFIRVTDSESDGLHAQYFSNGIAGPQPQSNDLQCE